MNGGSPCVFRSNSFADGQLTRRAFLAVGVAAGIGGAVRAREIAEQRRDGSLVPTSGGLHVAVPLTLFIDSADPQARLDLRLLETRLLQAIDLGVTGVEDLAWLRRSKRERAELSRLLRSLKLKLVNFVGVTKSRACVITRCDLASDRRLAQAVELAIRGAREAGAVNFTIWADRVGTGDRERQLDLLARRLQPLAARCQQEQLSLLIEPFDERPGHAAGPLRLSTLEAIWVCQRTGHSACRVAADLSRLSVYADAAGWARGRFVADAARPKGGSSAPFRWSELAGEGLRPAERLTPARLRNFSASRPPRPWEWVGLFRLTLAELRPRGWAAASESAQSKQPDQWNGPRLADALSALRMAAKSGYRGFVVIDVRSSRSGPKAIGEARDALLAVCRAWSESELTPRNVVG